MIAGLLLRAVPALLTDLGIDGYVTIGVFGVALFHALSTAPMGIAGQIAGLTGWPKEAAMIAVENLSVRFGGIKPIDALTAVLAAPVSGLIGPNGAGKTTLLNVLSGFVPRRIGRFRPSRRKPCCL